MNQADETMVVGEVNRNGRLTAWLKLGALLAGFAITAWSAGRMIELSRAGALSGSNLLGSLAIGFGGLGLALLVWGLAEVLHRLDEIRDLLARGEQASAADAGGHAGGHADSGPRSLENLNAGIEELISLTREVRDVSLLSENDRARRVQVQGRALLAVLQQEIPALLQNHQWVEARRRIQHARERFPVLDEWDQLDQQIENMRGNVEARDVEGATRQVNDLAALGAWERATGVVRELLERHPNSPKVQELARRVSIQREKADAEQRARLMAQAQEAVNEREWNRALTLANDLLRRYPRSLEADALRQQLATLTENAEIQTRQQMESDFREQMKQRQYSSALRLANELLERYPNSPQAEALRGQLPRLQQLASK
jgi:hypothetical protein